MSSSIQAAAPQPMIARSYLFVPGDRPDRFDKACSAGADRVIVLRINAESKGAAVALDGRMVDRPVILKAEQIVREAARRWSKASP